MDMIRFLYPMYAQYVRMGLWSHTEAVDEIMLAVYGGVA